MQNSKRNCCYFYPILYFTDFWWWKKSKLEFSSRSGKNNVYFSEGKHATVGSVNWIFFFPLKNVDIIGKLWAVCCCCCCLYLQENKSSILMVPHDNRILLKNLSLYFHLWVQLSFIQNFIVQELIKYSAPTSFFKF